MNMRKEGIPHRFLGRPIVLATFGVGGALLLWELLSRWGVLPREHFPTISATFGALGRAAAGSQLWTAIGDTFEGWVVGLGIAALVGVPIGLAIGSNAYLFRAARVVLEFLRPIPSVALIPIAVLLYGNGLQSKVLLVAFASVWPLLVQALYGVHDVDGAARDTMRVFGLNAAARARWLTLPSALPYVATGLRIASAVALIVAITVEIVIGAPGVGSAISQAQNGGNVALTYGLVLVTGVMGLLVNVVLTQLERRVLRGHPSLRGTR